jgi:hypothetical protein
MPGAVGRLPVEDVDAIAETERAVDRLEEGIPTAHDVPRDEESDDAHDTVIRNPVTLTTL